MTGTWRKRSNAVSTQSSNSAAEKIRSRKRLCNHQACSSEDGRRKNSGFPKIVSLIDETDHEEDIQSGGKSRRKHEMASTSARKKSDGKKNDRNSYLSIDSSSSSEDETDSAIYLSSSDGGFKDSDDAALSDSSSSFMSPGSRYTFRADIPSRTQSKREAAKKALKAPVPSSEESDNKWVYISSSDSGFEDSDDASDTDSAIYARSSDSGFKDSGDAALSDSSSSFMSPGSRYTFRADIPSRTRSKRETGKKALKAPVSSSEESDNKWVYISSSDSGFEDSDDASDTDSAIYASSSDSGFKDSGDAALSDSSSSFMSPGSRYAFRADIASRTQPKRETGKKALSAPVSSPEDSDNKWVHISSSDSGFEDSDDASENEVPDSVGKHCIWKKANEEEEKNRKGPGAETGSQNFCGKQDFSGKNPVLSDGSLKADEEETTERRNVRNTANENTVAGLGNLEERARMEALTYRKCPNCLCPNCTQIDAQNRLNGEGETKEVLEDPALEGKKRRRTPVVSPVDISQDAVLPPYSQEESSDNRKRRNLNLRKRKGQSCPDQNKSKQKCADKEVNGGGKMNLHSRFQSCAGTKRKRADIPSSRSLEEEDGGSIKGTGSCHQTTRIHGGYPNEEQVRASQRKKETRDQAFYRNIVDLVLENKSSVLEGSDEAAKKGCALLKFRFEDLIPKPPEKSEHEKMVDELFAEMDMALTFEEIGSYGRTDQVDDENKNVSDSEENVNQVARCAKGNHSLVLDEEIGLRCSCCSHVELQAKEVMPPFAEKTYRGVDRKRSGREEPCIIHGLDFAPSVENVSGLSSNANGTVWDLKPGIKETMYEHQQEGFEFLWKNLAGTVNLAELKSSESFSNIGGCIISHAPGTGKTRLTMVFLETYLKLFPDSRPVIIAPASMLLTWEEEFRKWKVAFPFHNLNNSDLSGKENKEARNLLGKGRCQDRDAVRMVKIYSWNSERSVLGVSYSLYEQLAGTRNLKEGKSKKRTDIDSEKMRDIFLKKPGLVVLDEGHTPRNKKSNIWNTLLKLQTERRIILSGTPFQNNFDELFNTLRLVRPATAESLAKEKLYAELIGSTGSFLNKAYREKGASSSKISENAIEKLKSAMEPFVHVHKGHILQQSLPGLRDCVVLLNPPELQKRAIENLDVAQVTFETEHKIALASVHPYLLKHCKLAEKEKAGIDQHALDASELDPNEGGKTRFLVELIRLSLALKEKVLIFSQYIQPLSLIKVQLKKVFNWTDGKQILQMQGKLEQKQRQLLINLFNDSCSEAKVLLASTRCCSEGINLVGASRVVLLDVVWNPSVERQAISRAYRIGQKKVVYTYHLMTCGTKEGDKYCRQAEKDRMSELVFAPSLNEDIKQKTPSAVFDDEILEAMVHHVKLKGMFEKIINQPKESDLIETFGVASS